MAADGGGGGSLHDEEGWSGRALSDSVPTRPHLQMPTTAVISPSPVSSGLDRERSSYGPIRAIRRIRDVPYERPAGGRHAAAGPQAAARLRAASAQALTGRTRSGRPWLGSGFSNIISTSATYLYSSIFRRHLQPPLQLADGDAQEVDACEPILSPSVDAGDDQARNGQSVRLEESDEPEVAMSSLTKVEDLLKRGKFSRDEIQRLNLLLQSRVSGNAIDADQRPKHVESDVISARQEVSPLGGSQSEAHRWRQDLRKSREERDNAVRTLTLYDNGRPSSTILGGTSERTDVLGSSPVEVAKAFMGGRPSQHTGSSPAEPSNQRDVNRVSSGPHLSPHVPQTALIKRPATEFWNNDQFRTPPPSGASPWNRSRMISRSPYSRPLRQHPPREKVVDGTFGSPATTRWTPIRTPVTGGREMLKRRSTVLDEGWSSGGPIRRTRQKGIVSVAQSSLSQPRRSEFPVTHVHGSSLATPVSPIVGKISPRTSDSTPRKEKELLTQSGNFFVPAQSSETARKILETLDRMTPSPKGKALEEELAHVRDRPPSTLTEGMLNDQARKSMRVSEFSLPNLPNESREPGPSGRPVEASPAFGSPESTLKTSESVSKVKGKGKAVLPPTENGPAMLSGSESNHERLGVGESPVKLMPVRPKEAEKVIIPESGAVTGFRMNAVFEESGSEDEGRATKGRLSAPPPISTSKLPILTSKSTTAMPSMFGAGPMSPPSTPVVGLSSFPRSSTAADAFKAISSGFTFPTSAPLECPPTPKAMSPVSNSPKAILAAPFSKFGQPAKPVAPSGSAVELNKSSGEKANSQPENKSELSFGSASASVASVAQVMPNFPSPLEPKVPNAVKHSSPFGGASFSVAPPSFSSTPAPVVATNSSSASGLKFGDSALPPPSTSAFKLGAVFPSTSPFQSSASVSLFGSGSSSAPSSSSVAPPSVTLSPSNSGSGIAPVPTSFAGTGGTGISGSAPGGLSGFGQVAAFSGFKSSSTTAGPLVSPDFHESAVKESGTTSLDAERPQKRTASLLQQQESSKRQEPVATMPSHSFTTFGTSIGTFAPTKPETVTFATSGASTTASTSLFAVSSFGQASTSTQQTSALPPAGPIPFTFGAPASSAGNMATTSSPAAGFGNAPSFPSFPVSIFGSASSGSTFGDSPISPMTFGTTTSSPSPFGSASANSVFGRLSGETGSQSPSTPVFGFSSPAPSTTPSFPTCGISSSPPFSFSAGATNSSSGPAFGFGFGKPGSFPFASKSAPSTQPSSVFGLSSSTPLLGFGSSPTTNGTMASDVVVNDQSNMDDNSMAEEPSSQIGGNLSPEPSIYGAQVSSGTGPYVFGSQTGGPGAAAPGLFGGFQAPSIPGLPTAAAANPFAAPQNAGSLDFAGGSFTLGSGGDRPATRKFIKAKRTSAKRGK